MIEENDEQCPETMFGSHELCSGSPPPGWHCGYCGALLSLGRWYPPASLGSGIFAGLGGRLDLGLEEEE